VPTIVPGSKPRLSAEELNQKIAPFNLDRSHDPVIVVGIRGYYKNTMGAPGVNDRGLYDDAIFIDTPAATISFNGNTDPSGYRKGAGFEEGKKGMAVLKPGLWRVHKFDKHKGLYLALCQRAGKVTVVRDGSPDYEDTGMFGINIHKGGYNGTSSIGCQTIHPDQWPAFINTAVDQAKRFFGEQWRNAVIPYVLIANN
jgi:lysozyme